MFEIHVYPNSFTHWIIYYSKLFGKMILQKQKNNNNSKLKNIYK